MTTMNFHYLNVKARWMLLLALAAILIPLSVANSENKGNTVTVTAMYKPLKCDVEVRSLYAKLGDEVRNDSVQAWGATISTTYTKGVLKYSVGMAKGTAKKLPAVVKFTVDKTSRAISFYDDGDRVLKYAPHAGWEVVVDGQSVWILDADMDGNPPELKEDYLVGPDAAMGQEFTGSFWTLKGGYDVTFEGKGTSIKAILTPIPFPGSITSDDISLAWAYFNCNRQRIGLKSLKWDEQMAKQCKAHTEYCTKTGETGHEEDPENPAYTSEGSRGGMSSNLGYASSDYLPSMIEQFRTVYHTAAMIHPGLHTSAMALTGKCFAVDVRNGYDSQVRGLTDITFIWPPHGATDVFCAFNAGGEHPMPVFEHTTDYRMKIGQAAFAHTYGTGNYRLILKNEKDFMIDIHLTHPERSGSLYGKNGGLISGAPKTILDPNTWYTATVGFTGSDGKPVSFTWRFRTGGK